MEAWIRFPIFVAGSYIVFAAVLYLVLRRRERVGLMLHVLAIGVLVIVGGMVFAKLGQNSGWPWWVYYTVPMLLTALLPPVYFQMNRREVPEYLVLSFLSAPVIHVLFSFLVGWKDYMPFVAIPSPWDLMG